MALKFPNYDKPRGLYGGSDIWDDDVAGVILLADYFDAYVPPPSGGPSLKYWNGSAQVNKPLKRWTGTVWENYGVLKRWNGSAWM